MSGDSSKIESGPSRASCGEREREGNLGEPIGSGLDVLALESEGDTR